MSLYAQYSALLDGALDELVNDGALPSGLDRKNVTVEPPRDASHGDLAVNAAMVLAKAAQTNPRALAELIRSKLAALPTVASVEIAGPGFINIRLHPDAWRDELRAILSQGDAYGLSKVGANERVNVEYVSANPTGPLHMGHCRGAVVGDSLARLLEAAGFRVTKEYYVNDAGAQVDTLARSVHLRYREALGETIEIGEGFYPGDYLKPVGVVLAAEHGARFVDAPEAEWLPLFRDTAIKAMLDLIRHDLGLLGIHHDLFSSEAALQQSGAVDDAMGELRSKGLVFEGVLERPKSLDPHDEWEPVELTLFRSTEFGDDQDRPMKKSDGSWTYFGADAAYHFQKAQKADHLVNIWGADHAGTVKRVQAAVRALTDGKVDLDVKLVNMVRLFRNGEPFKMSKRAGDFVTLADVVNEVGKDAVRFMMLTKRADTPLDFDFTKVVEASKDNPVFYVQYAHARVSSLKRKAAEAGIDLTRPADLSLLDDEELMLVKRAAQYSRVLESAALSHEPHRIAFYLYDLAAEFHALWNRGNDDPERRFLLDKNPQLSRARLELALGIAQIIRSGLDLMGVAATEEMR
ncbi:arginine--tRNA ligase [Sphingomonas flavescens]|uniref:arginine--tRNA ligase n=1 Tax=Sphingomonas flavescens TaxID=3132797 RepID=UPI0028051E89|nr:arginine--tRNA ligase [Sphingomonas limnosediminicola]